MRWQRGFEIWDAGRGVAASLRQKKDKKRGDRQTSDVRLTLWVCLWIAAADEKTAIFVSSTLFAVLHRHFRSRRLAPCRHTINSRTSLPRCPLPSRLIHPILKERAKERDYKKRKKERKRTICLRCSRRFVKNLRVRIVAASAILPLSSLSSLLLLLALLMISLKKSFFSSIDRSK